MITVEKITVGERMAKIETTLDYIKRATDDNKEEHKEIIKLFTDALKTKADKKEVDDLRDSLSNHRLNSRSWVQWIPSAITAVIAIVLFIITRGA